MLWVNKTVDNFIWVLKRYLVLQALKLMSRSSSCSVQSVGLGLFTLPWVLLDCLDDCATCKTVLEKLLRAICTNTVLQFKCCTVVKGCAPDLQTCLREMTKLKNDTYTILQSKHRNSNWGSVTKLHKLALDLKVCSVTFFPQAYCIQYFGFSTLTFFFFYS